MMNGITKERLQERLVRLLSMTSIRAEPVGADARGTGIRERSPEEFEP
jgi:hypothetical protein